MDSLQMKERKERKKRRREKRKIENKYTNALVN